jgi:hypothetical protein
MTGESWPFNPQVGTDPTYSVGVRRFSLASSLTNAQAVLGGKGLRY